MIKDINSKARNTGLSPNDVLAVGTTACAFLPQAALIAGGVTLAIYLGYKLYQDISAEGYIREDGSIRTSKAYFDSIRLKLEKLCGKKDSIILEGQQLYPTVSNLVWTYYYNGLKTCNLVSYTPTRNGVYRNFMVETKSDLPYEIIRAKDKPQKFSYTGNFSAYGYVDMYRDTSNPAKTCFYFQGSKGGDIYYFE